MSSWNEFRLSFRVWQLKIFSCPLETNLGCYLEFGSKFDLSSWEEKKIDGEFNGRLHFEGLEREELQMLLLQIRGLEATRLTDYSATANSALSWDVASTKWSSSPRADSLHHQFHCPRRCSREAYNTTSPSLDSGHRTGRRLWSLDLRPL
jgi:hypothetical protein